MEAIHKDPRDISVKEYQEFLRTLKSSDDDVVIPGVGETWHEEDVIDFSRERNGKSHKVHTYRMNPKGEPKAIVFLFHGWNDTMLRLAHIARVISEAGHVVFAFDQVGFGKSEGERGFIKNLDDTLDDAEAFIGEVSSKFALTLPKFIMGESLGGHIVYRLGLRHADWYKGVVMIAPAIHDQADYEKFMKGVAKFLGKIFPRLALKKQDGEGVNFYSNIGDEFENHPHTFAGKVTAGTGAALLNAMKYSTDNLDKLEAPFAVIQGGCDKLCDARACFEMYDQSPSKDKEMMYYPDLWHAVTHEPNWEEIMVRVGQWISKRS